MKAWEEHASDLYLLLNDILDNHYAQRRGYKGKFYYRFNPSLAYLRADTQHDSQLMLLRQLADMGALSFRIKDPLPGTPEQFFSLNAQRYPGQLIELTIKPYEFDSAFKEFRKYRIRNIPESERTSSTKLDPITGILSIGRHTIQFRTSTSMYDLLRVILDDEETRTQDWCYEEMSHELSKPPDADGNTFVRNTGYNINKRIAKETNKTIPKLLHVTSRSVRLRSEFV